MVIGDFGDEDGDGDLYIMVKCMSVCLSVCLGRKSDQFFFWTNIAGKLFWQVGKLFLQFRWENYFGRAGGKIILADGKIILAGGKNIKNGM